MAYKVKLTKEHIEDMKVFYKTHTRKETSAKFNVSTFTVSYHCGSKRIFDNPEVRKEKASKAVSQRRRDLKVMLVEYKGGCCQRCGYKKYIGALEFHHTDPSMKDFNPSNGGSTRTYEFMKKEVDKCVLVCANCHREIHHELRK